MLRERADVAYAALVARVPIVYQDGHRPAVITTDRDLLPEDLATRLNMSTRRVHELLRNRGRELGAYKVGKTWRVPVETFERWKHELQNHKPNEHVRLAVTRKVEIRGARKDEPR